MLELSLTPAQPDPHRVVLVSCPEPTLVFGTLYWEIPSDTWTLVFLSLEMEVCFRGSYLFSQLASNSKSLSYTEG